MNFPLSRGVSYGGPELLCPCKDEKRSFKGDPHRPPRHCENKSHSSQICMVAKPWCRCGASLQGMQDVLVGTTDTSAGSTAPLGVSRRRLEESAYRFCRTSHEQHVYGCCWFIHKMAGSVPHVTNHHFNAQKTVFFLWSAWANCDRWCHHFHIWGVSDLCQAEWNPAHHKCPRTPRDEWSGRKICSDIQGRYE